MSRTLTASIRPALAALCLLAALAAPAQARVVEGQSFDDKVEVGGQALQLNGVGLRAVAWLKGYVAALYLPHKSTSADEVLKMEGRKRVDIRMLEAVASTEFTKAFQRGVKRNSNDQQMKDLEERIQAFSKTIDAIGPLRKGERIELDFVPDAKAEGGGSLQLRVGGQPRGTPVPGADFYAAVLRVFIGPKPTDPELKVGLLGGPVS